MASERPLTLTPSEYGLPDGWTPARFHDELERAAASFSGPAVPCASLRLTVAPTAARRIATEDGTSLVVFRPGQWCHNSVCGHLDTFPFRAMAMTETHPSGAHGTAIAEADIELNSAHFRFTDATTPVNLAERAVPLRAVLLHELGHVLGLEDRCVSAGARGVHANGPELDRCGPHEAESIMFAPALNLALSPLDVAALCTARSHAGTQKAAVSQDTSLAQAFASSALTDTLLPIALVLALSIVLVRVVRLT